MSDAQHIAGVDQRTLDLAHHAVDMEQEQASRKALTPLELAALQNDDVVYDATGDAWTKVDGLWVCHDAKMSSESLTHVWGPITKEEQ